MGRPWDQTTGGSQLSKVYFVATKHAQYATADYEPDSVIIDPWRYIPTTKAARVHRVGENKPPLISVLVPSRGRPDWLARTIRTAYNTATYQRRVEFVIWLDDDDTDDIDYALKARFSGPADLPDGLIRILRGPRTLLSECWNRCAEHARGEIMMHCGDDLTFDSPGWDAIVRQAFADTPDKILFAYGNDLGPHGETFGTHGFLHRKWVETVGYFVPPLFSSDWNDVWLNEVAQMIGRHRLLPFVTEHHHYTFGKAERDQTHAEREERGARDDVVNLYKRTQKEREADAAKLRAAMA